MSALLRDDAGDGGLHQHHRPRRDVPEVGDGQNDAAHNIIELSVNLREFHRSVMIRVPVVCWGTVKLREGWLT